MCTYHRFPIVFDINFKSGTAHQNIPLHISERNPNFFQQFSFFNVAQTRVRTVKVVTQRKQDRRNVTLKSVGVTTVAAQKH